MPSTISKPAVTNSTAVTVGPKIPPRLRVLFIVLLCTVPLAWLAAWWNQSRNDRFGEPDVMIAAPDTKPVISLSYDPTHTGTLLISASDKSEGGGVILWESTDKADKELPTRDAGAFGIVSVRRNRTLRLYGNQGGGAAFFSPTGKYIATWNGKLEVWQNKGLGSRRLWSWKAAAGQLRWENPESLLFFPKGEPSLKFVAGTGKKEPITAVSQSLSLETDRFLLIVSGKVVAIKNKTTGVLQELAGLDAKTFSTATWSIDGQQLATADKQGWVYHYEQAGNGKFVPAKKRPRFSHAQNPGDGAPYATAIAFSPDNKTLATGGTDGAVFLWRL